MTSDSVKFPRHSGTNHLNSPFCRKIEPQFHPVFRKSSLSRKSGCSDLSYPPRMRNPHKELISMINDPMFHRLSTLWQVHRLIQPLSLCSLCQPPHIITQIQFSATIKGLWSGLYLLTLSFAPRTTMLFADNSVRHFVPTQSSGEMPHNELPNRKSRQMPNNELAIVADFPPNAGTTTWNLKKIWLKG